VSNRYKLIKAAGEVSEAIIWHTNYKRTLKVQNNDLKDGDFLKYLNDKQIKNITRLLNILEIRLNKLLLTVLKNK
jgi:hypothetical protein